jgi:hypothetical protein
VRRVRRVASAELCAAPRTIVLPPSSPPHPRGSWSGTACASHAFHHPSSRFHSDGRQVAFDRLRESHPLPTPRPLHIRITLHLASICPPSSPGPRISQQPGGQLVPHNPESRHDISERPLPLRPGCRRSSSANVGASVCVPHVDQEERRSGGVEKERRLRKTSGTCPGVGRRRGGGHAKREIISLHPPIFPPPRAPMRPSYLVATHPPHRPHPPHRHSARLRSTSIQLLV